MVFKNVTSYTGFNKCIDNDNVFSCHTYNVFGGWVVVDKTVLWLWTHEMTPEYPMCSTARTSCVVADEDEKKERRSRESEEPRRHHRDRSDRHREDGERRLERGEEPPQQDKGSESRRRDEKRRSKHESEVKVQNL